MPAPDETPRAAPEDDDLAVELHPHRGIGWGLYGTATAVVFLLVVLGAGTNLLGGRPVMGAVIAVVGLGVTGFLGLATHALVVPVLTADATGVRGRLPSGRRVDAAWADVTVDAAGEPGAFRLGVADETLTLTARSWVGFGPFLFLVAATPVAVGRLTPAAVAEVTRLIHAGITTRGPVDRSTRP